MTAAGIDAIVTDIRERGLSSSSSRGTQYRARDESAGRMTVYGQLVHSLEVLALASDEPIILWAQNPLAMFHQSFEESEAFRELVLDTARRRPPRIDQPWSLVGYVDEIGYVPMKHDRRKTHGFYWSILEFGPTALSSEDAWFVVAVVRSDIAKMVKGAVSHIWKRILKELFFNRSGFDVSRSGVAIANMLIFLKMGLFVADIPALKDVFKFLGHSAVKLCHFCPHVVSVSSLAAATVDSRSYLQLSTCLDIRKRSYLRKCHTDASVRLLLDELCDAFRKFSEGRMEKQEYDALCKDYGFAHHDENLLRDDQLAVGAISMCMYDWMHIYLVNGLFNHEFVWLMVFLGSLRSGFNYDALDRHCQQWTYPVNAKSVKSMFAVNGCRPASNADHLACSASEGLGMYPIFRMWLVVACLAAGVCDAQVKSMLALCAVLDMLQSVKHGGVSGPALGKAILAHLTAYKQAYGDVGWLPKHHYSIHLPGFLEKFGTLLALWVQERRHCITKRFGTDRRNTTAFERSLMQEITLQHLSDLRKKPSFMKTQLQKPKQCNLAQQRVLEDAYGPPGDQQYLCSALATHHNGCKFHAGEVCVYRHGHGWCYGKISFHADISGVCVSCLEVWDQTECDDFFVVAGSRSARAACVPTADLVSSCIYHENRGRAVIIKPYHVL